MSAIVLHQADPIGTRSRLAEVEPIVARITGY
jgi:hypothetical protein